MFKPPSPDGKPLVGNEKFEGLYNADIYIFLSYFPKMESLKEKRISTLKHNASFDHSVGHKWLRFNLRGGKSCQGLTQHLAFILRKTTSHPIIPASTFHVTDFNQEKVKSSIYFGSSDVITQIKAAWIETRWNKVSCSRTQHAARSGNRSCNLTIVSRTLKSLSNTPSLKHFTLNTLTAPLFSRTLFFVFKLN